MKKNYKSNCYTMTRSIEQYFPIVEINKLAVPERNSFKPIYQMHKWFARRSSSVFRAILLGAMKPAGTDIMEEFYKDHTNDPDTNGKVILDPFMGGGTTVVEALRLGCKVIGIDLNPVAWFIVKTEVEPVNIDELKKAFERLSKRKVEWSGKSLKDTLLELYKTECPGCGNKDADIIYTFWVKSAPCTTALCNSFTPLFPDYIVAAKSPSIRYFPDTTCPHCKEKFDWEKEPASLIADKKLMVNSGKFSAGEGRTNARWAYSETENVICPWCSNDVKPKPQSAKLERKKIPLTVLNCPNCEEVWQFRGTLSDEVECPTCKHLYNPKEGNIPSKGKFICRGSCGGNVDNIINAIRQHPANELLPTKAYAVEGYCERCAGKLIENKSLVVREPELKFDNESETVTSEDDWMTQRVPPAFAGMTKKEGERNLSLIWKNNGKFFKKVSVKDAAKFKEASEIWNKEKDKLPYPKSEIPVGYNTNQMLKHNYKYWYQMFNDRQLLGLSTLLKGISEEEDQVMKEMLLSGFYSALEGNNLFCRYTIGGGNKSQGIFSRHDFQPKSTSTENNIWGSEYGHGTFQNKFNLIIEGKHFCQDTFDRKLLSEKNGKNIFEFVPSKEIITTGNARVYSQSSEDLSSIISEPCDLIITDPPYADNVNYSELSDFFYVWLRLVLIKDYKKFGPEYTPKLEEIIENKTRNKSLKDFKGGLKKVFIETNKILNNDGILAFTFHHAQGNTWEVLLEAICESDYYIEAIIPIHGDAETSLHLMDKESIAYDLIHVCKKIDANSKKERRSWSGIRNEIRKKAREEVKIIEAGRYGRGLSEPDVNLLLIGKCLELYSKNYGMIVDHEDKPVSLGTALEQIKMMVDQIITKENPIPTELENIDVPSYVYFTSLFASKEINSDDVHKNTKGLIETSKLREHGLIIKGREKRGRTFEVKQPIERLNDLKLKFRENGNTGQEGLFGEDGSAEPKDILFVDYVHLLLGVAENGENLIPWLEKFRGKKPMLRAACQYLISRGRFIEPAKKILALIDERTLFNTKEK